MERSSSRKSKISIRPYEPKDFDSINQLNKLEEWGNLVANSDELEKAWSHSNVTYIAELDGEIVGYVRGLTDEYITLFICELLIKKEHRGKGMGKELLNYVHQLYPKTRMELLASSTSRTFYEQKQFRPFYGYRKTISE
ncbi:GNAT family N-acetyltransferase [Virgibacillus sp. SK37]|uniref:GNAT family N-acetyltransferase n=1 Tax=Virgibacillus sp. SK37 TaxID=403957 RepID=UPI0005956488|nr:GNAT family N-acetyltransferase [Virgibacillus sp. SK37]